MTKEINLKQYLKINMKVHLETAIISCAIICTLLWSQETGHLDPWSFFFFTRVDVHTQDQMCVQSSLISQIMFTLWKKLVVSYAGGMFTPQKIHI